TATTWKERYVADARTAGCVVEAYSTVGAPDLVLEELSEKAALIVIGRRGHNILERFLGTTSRHVIEHAKCAVTVIPEPRQKKS
ncbi:MAG TPA: universal stress protein, partial [Ilumatobacteraceae bacterium]|nr:universal stress protein [Ilumatobacteraceae bacterium]